MSLNIVLVIQALLLTIGTLLIFSAIMYFGNIVFDQEKLHRTLRLQKNYKFFEFTIFKFCLFALLAYWCVVVILQFWGASRFTRDSFEAAITQGTYFYGFRIIPMRLVLALMVYAIIQMAWKYALLYYAKNQKFDPDDQSHVVLTSLLSYVVLGLAILFGLLVSGVDFTGIAIVAGALSVGIGFGLQNIVNNFVSGIIILLENTIKPGDRVMIKGYEGYVRKIHFRYTRIETLHKEDVMIPNSDLITTPIINYEFDSSAAKLKCRVGVAFNSDVDLVKETLINVALKHPDVLRDPINKPVVFMSEFAESNIIFELSCIINDVNNKSDINSDLNFLIAKAFRENNIEMAYPQRDVHLIQGT